MANKQISQFAALTLPDPSSQLLIEEDGVYYSISVQELGFGMVRVITTLTRAQIQALATPITFLAAQGAGKVIMPVHVGLFLDHNGTSYATATTLRLHHSGQTNYLFTSSSAFINATADRYEQMVEGTTGSTTLQPQYANTALMVSANANATNNGGTITIDALLRIVTFG